MNAVTIAPTVDRSVLGIMVDFAHAVPSYLKPGWSGDALAAVEDQLAQTPGHASRAIDQVVFPNDKALALLHARWPSRPSP